MCEAGDAFCAPPGRVPLHEADSELLFFSPAEELNERTVRVELGQGDVRAGVTLQTDDVGQSSLSKLTAVHATREGHLYPRLGAVGTAATKSTGDCTCQGR